MAETEQSKAKCLRTGVLCHNLVPKDHSEGPRNEVVFASARDHTENIGGTLPDQKSKNKNFC